MAERESGSLKRTSIAFLILFFRSRHDVLQAIAVISTVFLPHDVDEEWFDKGFPATGWEGYHVEWCGRLSVKGIKGSIEGGKPDTGGTGRAGRNSIIWFC
jgi:hypothetical protein